MQDLKRVDPRIPYQRHLSVRHCCGMMVPWALKCSCGREKRGLNRHKRRMKNDV